MRTQSRAMMCAVAITTLAAITSGCSDSNLPDYVRLGGLRILGIKADFPEVNPGATVVVTPLVSDLGNDQADTGGRTLTYSAQGCIDPGVGFGATPTCVGRSDATSLGSGTIPSLDSSSKTFTGTAPAINVTIPATILSNRTILDQQNGVAYLVMYTLTATATNGTQTQINAFKRILVSAPTRTQKNVNPVLTEVNAGDVPLSSFLSALTFPGGSGTQTPTLLKAVLDPNSSENYTLISANGTLSKTESLTTTWFLSDGDIQLFRTVGADTNSWSPPNTKPSTRAMLLVVVTRDGRGGETYRVFQL